MWTRPFSKHFTIESYLFETKPDAVKCSYLHFKETGTGPPRSEARVQEHTAGKHCTQNLNLDLMNSSAHVNYSVFIHYSGHILRVKYLTVPTENIDLFDYSLL